MWELYEQIVSRRTSVERLMVRLPGFAGYLDKKARQVADRMVRDYITAEMSKRINRLAVLEKILLDAGGSSYLSKTNSAKTRMRLFHDRLQSAAPGYSGPFQRAKIRPEEMEKLTNFDEAQLRYVDRFDEALEKLAGSVSAMTGIEEAIEELNLVALEALESYSRRENVLTHLSKSL